MPTTTKFYLHDATTTVSGTLPGATDLSSSTPSQTVTGATTNRSMNGTIGTSQVSQAYSTLANQTAQPTWIRRFISEPLGVNSFGAVGLLNMGLAIGRSYSNTNSNFAIAMGAWIWRPTTGAVVGTLVDNMATDTGPATATIDQRWIILNLPSIGSVSSADGDVLVVEVWRSTRTQSHSSSYTNSVFYDGTVEGSLTVNLSANTDTASLVWFYATGQNGTPTPVEMSAGAPPPADRVPYRNPMPPLIAQ